MDITRLTASGRSAIASILVEGADVSLLCELLHFPAKTVWSDLQRNVPLFARFILDHEQGVEHVVLHLLDATRCEIHSHGGDAVVAAMIRTLQNRFDATVLSQPDTPENTDPGSLIPFAKTERIVQILIDQYHGALDRELALIKTLNQEETAKRIARLEENARLGRRILTPFRVVLFGPVNSGKSSLVNAIVGYERVIVHCDAGTTRDAVGVSSVVDGWPITLIDTAGIRATEHELEREGIKRSFESLQNADLVLKIVDLSVPVEKREHPVDHCPRITVVNKWDLAEVQARVKENPAKFADAVCVSSKTEQGLESLLSRISKELVPHPPEPGEAVPLN